MSAFISNGVKIDYLEAGRGFPLVFCHEHSGDRRGLELQVRHYSRFKRCVAYNYRGYPASDVPSGIEDYSPEAVIDDLLALLDHLKIDQCDLYGFATGGGIALNFAILYPSRVRSLVLVGMGAGSTDRGAWIAACERGAIQLETRGIKALAQSLANAPQRQSLQRKDPIGWGRFLEELDDLSAQGLALMLRGNLMRRRPINELADSISQLPMPVLVVSGDRDLPSFDPCVLISRTAPFGALSIIPCSGHMLPLEEPDLLNQITDRFFLSVAEGTWGEWRATPNMNNNSDNDGQRSI